jgi:hypothetical protein
VALSGTVDDHREAVEGAKFMEQQVRPFYCNHIDIYIEIQSAGAAILL